MGMDWIDIGYAAILTLGGAVGYIRKGSKISLIAGLSFGLMAGIGGFFIAQNPRDVKFSLLTAFILTTVMGVRFKRSKKLMPAGIIAALSNVLILGVNMQEVPKESDKFWSSKS